MRIQFALRVFASIVVCMMMVAFLGCPAGGGDGEGAGDGAGEGGGEGVGDGAGEGVGDGSGEGEGEGAGGGQATLLGWVTDTEQTPLPLVEVTVGSSKAYTDGAGLYTFENVEAGTGVTVSFSLDGYAPNSRNTDIVDGQTSTVNATLVARAAVLALADAFAGGTVDDGDGNSITFPPGTLLDSNRKQVQGSVEVQITALDVMNEADLAAFPGNFTGLQGKQGDPVQLETYALADFYVTQDGEELQLGSGASIQLSLPVETPLQAGEEVPLWSFDEDQGLWIQSGTGMVESDGAGGLVYVADIAHLSWWNCDKPLSDKQCISGRVVDGDGNPVQGASIEATGLDYNGTSYATTDANGEYCVDVKRGSRVRVDLILPGGRLVVDSIEVTVPDESASCETGGCTDMRELTTSFDSCVSGRVVGEDGTAIIGADVFSSFGGRTVTVAPDGAFCMEAPADTDVTVFVVGRPSVGVHTPPLATCAAGDCADVLLNVEFPEPGDVVGFVSAMIVDAADFEFKQLPTALSSSAFFFSFFVPEGFEEEGFDFNSLLEPTEMCEITFSSYDPSDLGDDVVGDSSVSTLIGALDPGAPGIVASGLVEGQMVRFSDFASQFGSTNLFLGPEAMGMFFQDPFVLPGVSSGDTVNYSWPGGIDIGAFEGSLVLPPALELSAPATVDGLGGVDIIDIDLSTDLLVEWNGSGQDHFVDLTISSTVTDISTFASETGSISCRLSDDGAHTVPGTLLSQLPTAAEGQVGLLSFSIQRIAVVPIEVPLAQGGGMGTVFLWGISEGVSAQSAPTGIPMFKGTDGHKSRPIRHGLFNSLLGTP